MKQLLIIFGLVVLISCCGTSKTKMDNQEMVTPEGRYYITSVKDTGLVTKDYIIEFSGKNQVSGMSGCNNFTTQYTMNDGKMNFSPITATKRYCEGEMEIEKAILGSISKTKKIVSYRGDGISFISEDGKQLITAKKLE